MFSFKNRLISIIYKTLQQNGFIGTRILDTFISPNLLKTTIQIPINKTEDDLIKLLPYLKESLSTHDFRIVHSHGKTFELEFGKRDISYIKYDKQFNIMSTLKIAIPSSFDTHYLDFEDGASCHCLIAGATRMGKTRALIYIINQLTIQTYNDITIYINSPKHKDFYPFNHIHKVSSDLKDIKQVLKKCITEYKIRNHLINHPDLLKATDAKDIKKMYPEYYNKFKPIFIIIDEFSRFSKDKEFNQLLIELSETAGYMNIHLIIATQRPDAKQVIPPSIKANLLCRIAFTTTTEGNSMVILDREGAEKLGGKQGRALILDGDITKIQFPDLNQEYSYKIMKQFKGVKKDEQEEKRPIDNKLDSKIQSMFEESNSNINI